MRLKLDDLMGDPLVAGSFQVSIVIPVGSGDSTWRKLLNNLECLPHDWELVLIMADAISEQVWQNLLGESGLAAAAVYWCLAKNTGRAHQLNQGGETAKGRWLWFLHADSQIGQDHISMIQNIIDSKKMTMFYFDLEFDQQGFSLLHLNQWGANLRSRVFGMPFGDQGYLMKKNLWQQIGKFDETLAYGEDHLLIWTCRQRNIALRRLPLAIRTSPRKYYRNGWLSTTLNHIMLTWAQAIPQIWKLIRLRMGLG